MMISSAAKTGSIDEVGVLEVEDSVDDKLASEELEVADSADEEDSVDEADGVMEGECRGLS